ncbi:hypothetical protein FQR65_LT16044 [Abscondita terminalis]|nr:hypothetical protein FQR65_LT16044 [Abscondita terminalis]
MKDNMRKITLTLMTAAFGGAIAIGGYKLFEHQRYDNMSFEERQKVYYANNSSGEVMASTEMSPELAKQKGLDELNGLYVQDVVANGAAKAAGIKPGDLITKIEDKVIYSSSDLQERVARLRPGDKVNLTVKSGGKERNVTVTLKAEEDTKKTASGSSKSATEIYNKLGASFVPASSARKKELGVNSGVVVAQHMVCYHLVDERGLGWNCSAGTGDWHIGQAPDHRSIAVAAKYGIDISNQKAQHFNPTLFGNKGLPDSIPEIALLEQLGVMSITGTLHRRKDIAELQYLQSLPKRVEYGCGHELYDFEGRIIRADFEKFSVMSTYFPSGTTGETRQTFKYQFLDDFQQYSDRLLKDIPNLIVCGDYNICHRAIDIHNPKSNANTSGFLPEEREWMENFINSGYVDSFRHLNPELISIHGGATERVPELENLGWRIDYNMVSTPLASQIENLIC